MWKDCYLHTQPVSSKHTVRPHVSTTCHIQPTACGQGRSVSGTESLLRDLPHPYCWPPSTGWRCRTLSPIGWQSLRGARVPTSPMEVTRAEWTWCEQAGHTYRAGLLGAGAGLLQLLGLPPPTTMKNKSVVPGPQRKQSLEACEDTDATWVRMFPLTREGQHQIIKQLSPQVKNLDCLIPCINLTC